VELFFLISGFVILMTLEKCRSAGEFLMRRWLRLFPAMLFCSLLIFFTSTFFHERPDGIPTPVSLLPGLTFIEPSWWQRALGVPLNSLEGGFWSIYVEFKFYVFAAIVFFRGGRNVLIGALAVAFAAAVMARLAEASMGGAHLALLNSVFRNASFEYFGWFAAGAAFFAYSVSNNRNWFVVAMSLAILSSAFVRPFEWQTFMAACLVSVFFAASLVSVAIRRLLSGRFLLIFGFISYPLYLMQENMMISMIAKLGHANTFLPAYLYPLIPVALISATAYVVARHVEPQTRKLLAALLPKRSP
jgi:peptidoglycan/LPS O-acetylase OafA/YrhL